MYYPPNQPPQYPPQPEQYQQSSGWQQPSYPPQPEQYQQPPEWQSRQSYPYQQPQYTPPPMSPLPPQKPKRSWYQRLFAWCRRHPIITAVIIVVILVSGIISNVTTSSTPSSTPATQATQPAQAQNTVAPTQAPTQAPTAAPTQAPTQSPAQAEQTYKAGATDTTVTTLDKDGNNDQGNIVHFTATLASFVKDDSGNTAGANVTDATYSAFIQIVFPAGTDISQINKGDTLEVWGQDMGTFSGANAFGATIQEVGVTAVYMTDQTTGYQAG